MPARRDRFSPEFRFVAACCRWPSDVGAVQAAAQGLDWTRVAAIATRHRVRGFVARMLAQEDFGAPPTLLTAVASRIAQDNLHGAATTVRLAGAIAAAGVEHRFFKGHTLGQRLYGSQGLKESVDVDLLVHPAALPAVTRVLRAAGFAGIWPGDLDDDALAIWARHRKEAKWHDGATLLELHWRLADDPATLPGLSAHTPAQTVAIAGAAVETFADAPLFAYLAFHGATHGWTRLKWLADFAALARTMDEAQLHQAVALADDLRVGHAVRQGLALARDLLGLTAPGVALPEGVLARWRVSLALAALGGRHEREEPRPGAWGTRHQIASALLVRPTPGAALRFIGVRLANPEDRLTARFPRTLAWLYPLVRVGRFGRSQ